MARDITGRDFVRGPFITCPKCGDPEFGVCSIHGQTYERRCRTCWFGQELYLWPLSRKVIYIDQFAISNMMKALNRAHPRHETAARDPFWRTLFERLDRLVKLQLAICPHSDVHRRESLLSGHFEAHKRMYEQLSHNMGFESVDAITQRQLNIAVLAWTRGVEPVYELDPDRVTGGRLNDWAERFIISVSSRQSQAEIASIRSFRNALHEKVAAFFGEQLQPSTRADFEYWLEREERLGSTSILESALLYYQRLTELASGATPFSLDSLYTSSGYQQFKLIQAVLGGGHGHPSAEVVSRIRTFLLSEVHKHFPSNRISTLVWAAIDRAAAQNQANPPNQGTSNDIQVLCLMPYCDAMFVDNGCRATWEKVPRRYRPAYAKARLFSYKTKEAFLAYLDEIEATGDPAVIRCARDVYGDPLPFITMYEERGIAREG